MSTREPDDEIDPAMERVRRKLVRLLFVSSGVMMIGFLAVLVAVLYKVSESTAPSPGEAIPLAIAPGDVREATVADGALVLTIGGSEPRIEVRDLSDGTLLRTFTLER